jgi:hypothetical protein
MQESGNIVPSAPSLNELFAALAKAQGEMGNAVKDSLNPHFKSKYADLAAVWDAIRAPLSRHGLAVVQLPVELNGKPFLRTVLGHASGQSIESLTPLIISKNDAQGFGSSLTYGRRFSLMAIVGIAPAEDDDGNAAVGRQAAPAPVTPVVVHPTREVRPDVKVAASNGTVSDGDYIVPVGLSKGLKLSDVPRENLQGAVSMLEQKLTGQKSPDPALAEYLERAKRILSNPTA